MELVLKKKELIMESIEETGVHLGMRVALLRDRREVIGRSLDERAIVF